VAKVNLKKFNQVIKNLKPDLAKDPQWQLIAQCNNIEYYKQRAIEEIKFGSLHKAIGLLMLAYYHWWSIEDGPEESRPGTP